MARNQDGPGRKYAVSAHAGFFFKKKDKNTPKKSRKIIFGVSDDNEPLVFPRNLMTTMRIDIIYRGYFHFSSI